jgi:hypothetical protein
MYFVSNNLKKISTIALSKCTNVPNSTASFLAASTVDNGAVLCSCALAVIEKANNSVKIKYFFHVYLDLFDKIEIKIKLIKRDYKIN